ncbi:multiprotein-bridging factor 1c-like [Nicotiana sylvestris]|uniref:Multiprotein-bridging factor 1c-like n=2 Tax=Nicotiana TaxID=4085 RepID=A0A1S4D3P1_TOBAC|nr:PREDICTED: multiprotein-bridging factor 1c-like [Nicotiana sylvestris]XP_016507894.1 PREDICTED: multiprotein-bridging factor 1c-like [Nicotiana tabacum]
MGICGSKKRPPPIIVNIHHNSTNHVIRNQNKPIKLKDSILQARNKKNLSQVQLAKKLNVKPQKIQEYESGKTIPSQVTISKLENILGVKLQDLYKTKLREDIKQARENMFMTQTQLAKKLKVKVQIIKDYENGKTIPKQNMISQLEKTLLLKLH